MVKQVQRRSGVREPRTAANGADAHAKMNPRVKGKGSKHGAAGTGASTIDGAVHAAEATPRRRRKPFVL